MRGVNIELGGKTRVLRYDFNALADVEERTGLGFTALFSADRVGFNTVRLLLWAGLKHEDRGLTTARVGTMIQEHLESGTLEGLVDKVKEALEASGLAGNVRTGATLVQ